jgi:hypothetical protein
MGIGKMNKEYTPRRASLARWLQDAPSYILDVFDFKNEGERYTVLFTKEMSSRTGSYSDTWVSFLGMSDAPSHPQGVSMWGEMKAYDTALYRNRVKHQRVRWLDLPQHIREHVIARATSD